QFVYFTKMFAEFTLVSFEGFALLLNPEGQRCSRLVERLVGGIDFCLQIIKLLLKTVDGIPLQECHNQQERTDHKEEYDNGFAHGAAIAASFLPCWRRLFYLRLGFSGLSAACWVTDTSVSFRNKRLHGFYPLLACELKLQCLPEPFWPGAHYINRRLIFLLVKMEPFVKDQICYFLLWDASLR